MKVGILSMQRVKNNGSFLQAYALCNVIKNEVGAGVEFVDFSTEHGVFDPCKEGYLALKSSPVKFFLIKVASSFTKIPLLGKLFRNNKKLRTWSNLLNYYKVYALNYEKKYWNDLPLTEKTLSESDADIIVIGSDEVFNYKDNNRAGYSDELFGDGWDGKLISFAACFGSTNLDHLDENTKEKLSNYLMRFNALSVRDENSKDIAEQLTKGKAEVLNHLDPVFHYGFERELPVIKRKPYIALYGYSGISEPYKDAIKKYAKKNKLDIVCLQGYQGDLGEYACASPFETLAYIKHASCVVTNTFHGAVFSAKYNKNFCVIIEDSAQYSNLNKLGDLIKRLSLESRLISTPDELDERLGETFDYEKTNRYINEAVMNGKRFIKDNISEK